MQKNGRNCSEGCHCINCENHALPSQDRQDLADVALEETVHNSMELEEEEFAEFVFAAAFDVDEVTTELLDEFLSCTTTCTCPTYKHMKTYHENVAHTCAYILL